MQLIERDVAVNGLRLHVYRTGSDKPPLVFAHGITDNGLCFLPIAEQLAEDFEIVLYDARGHGRSDSSPPGTTPLDRARDLGALIEALQLRKPGLLGHSMGGAAVALFAGLSPELPGYIILEDPQPFETLAAPGDQAIEMRARWREMNAANKRKSVDELIQISRQNDPTWPEAERLPWAQAKQQVSLTVFEEGFIDDIESVKRIVSQIVCPTLLITADPEMGSLFTAAAAEDLVASLPLARHVSIPGAGHNIRREQPGPYLEALRDFLRADT
jgi:pimeloyl-ACP methyl ester carboxylesterase